MYQFINFYDLLDLPQNASHDDILVALDREMKQWHPSRYPGVSGRQVMRDIIEAKRILLHDALRASYDKEYHRRKMQGALPPPIVKQEFESDYQVLWNEIAMNTQRYQLVRSAFGHKVIENPQPNLSDERLLHVVDHPDSYRESTRQYAIRELLKRQYTQEEIDRRLNQGRMSTVQEKATPIKNSYNIGRWFFVLYKRYFPEKKNQGRV